MKKRKWFISIIIAFIMILVTNICQATMSLEQLQNTYQGKWTDTYQGKELRGTTEYTINASECAGFAALMYYNYYGIDPYATAERVYDVEQVQPGDIVRYHNEGHSVWILSRNGENVQVAECNYDRECSVGWYHTKSMNELRSGFNYIYKAPYVLGGTEPALNSPSGVQASLSGNTLNVSWNRPAMASGYIVKIFSADSVANNNFSSPVETKEIKFPSITNTSMSFNKTGDFYVYVYTKRGDRTSASGSGGIKISSYPITSVEISSTETGNMIVGDKRMYTAKVLPENTTATDKSITWSVSNSSVASVDQNGIVTALKDGGAYIYAKASNGVSANVYIRVTYTEVPITSVSISGAQWVYEGRTTQLSATISPNNATGDKTIKWSSQDENIAKVDSNGLVTGIQEGSTRIKAETVNGLLMTWKMEVKPGIKVTDITLNKTSMELLKGNSEKITAVVSPYNATNRTVTWSSSNSNIAIVDENGNVIAESEGTAIITAKCGDISKTCNVKVYDVKVNLSEKTHTFTNLAENLQLTVTLSNNEDVEFEWKSSNVKVLKVDNNGKVTPVAGGFADITVTDKKYGKSLSCRCYVQALVTLSDGSKAYVGDMDKNGFFNSVDSSIIQDAFKNGPTADQYLLGDVNGDGFVNGIDSAIISDLYVTNDFCPGKYYPITDVKLNKNAAAINKGKTEILTATINPENTTDSPNLTWTSSNEKVAKVDNNGKITTITSGIADIMVKTSNGKTSTCKLTVTDYLCPSVKYRTHVQKEGWQEYVKDGTKSGTTGKALRLEGIKIELDSQITGGIKYSTHVQKEGWQNYVENGALSGTTGKGLRLEAIKIELTGEIAKQYDIYYRVHAQKSGWMGWARNGEEAGTQGYGYRLEAIEVKLVKKGETTPTSTVAKFSKCPTITYQSYVQKEGWQSKVSNGAISGTTGKGLRLEGIKINLNTYGVTGGIKYSAHVQKEGWQNYVENGALSGTTEKELRLEAIKIELTGDMTKQFDVYYRVHAEKFGWMGWAKNGEKAGTQGYGYRIEAIEIKIVVKGTTAPGKTDNFFSKK